MSPHLPDDGIQRPSDQVTWRRAIAHGLLFGTAATSLESAALPLGIVAVDDFLLFVMRMVLIWSLFGIVLAKVMPFLARGSASVLVAATLVFLTLPVGGFWLMHAYLPYTPSPTAVLKDDLSYLHIWWGGLVYSALFVLACRLHARTEQTRTLLASAQIARAASEGALASARLQALQGHLNPAFLLRVMLEVERRYQYDVARVDRLLDQLVGFLRAAMPAVRSGVSTLGAELLLARLHAQVCSELGPCRPDWTIRVERSVPNIPFPPLLLVPVLEELEAACGSPARLCLTRGADREHCTLTLEAAAPLQAPWLSAALEYRLRVGLRASFGNGFHLAIGRGPTSPAFVLSLPNVETSHSPPTCSTHQETVHE